MKRFAILAAALLLGCSSTTAPEAATDETLQAAPKGCRGNGRWKCPVDPPPPSRPQAVEGLALSIDGSDLVVEWIDNPSPDANGTPTLGYYVVSGSNTTNISNPAGSVAGSPFRIPLSLGGSHWTCVTAWNDSPNDVTFPKSPAGHSKPACWSIIFGVVPPPQDIPFLLRGPYDQGDGTLSLQVLATPLPDALTAGFTGISKPLSAYQPNLEGVDPFHCCTIGTILPDGAGWWWWRASSEGQVVVHGGPDPFIPWIIDYAP